MEPLYQKKNDKGKLTYEEKIGRRKAQ